MPAPAFVLDDDITYKLTIKASVFLGADKRFYVRQEQSGDPRTTIYGPIDCPDVADRLAREIVQHWSAVTTAMYGTAMARLSLSIDALLAAS